MVGLRFVLFEGYLEQALAFSFQILMVFYQPNEHKKFGDTQLPVTSARFKFSCVDDLKKQLLFAFYSYCELETSKWLSLDSKCEKRSLFARKLPLHECTYNNIKALQSGSDQLLSPPAWKNFSSKEILQRRRSDHGISLVGFSKESPYLKVGFGISNYEKKIRDISSFAPSFSAPPTFFLGLHLRLLLEHSVAQNGFQDHNPVENQGSFTSPIVDECSSSGYCLNRGLEGNYEIMKSLDKHATSDNCMQSTKQQNGDVNVNGISSNSHEPEKVGGYTDVPSHEKQEQPLVLDQGISSSRSSADGGKINPGSGSIVSGIRVEIPPLDEHEKHADGELHGNQNFGDLTWNMNAGVIPSPNPTARRSSWHRNRSSSSSMGYLANGWLDGKADFLHNNFGGGPKKPRTQVSYSMPFGALDYNMKNKGHNQKGLPHKRIRRANERRLSDVSRCSKKSPELLSCVANLLITLGDRGWRECDAEIVLEVFDHNEWKLAVKVSGNTRYSYKAHQFLQPGSTNRYTHAMMWKGGKDWILEFPDRSQWALFKEMHEECYNRNIRAASVKNIPIPGVCLIEEYDDNVAEATFFRCSSKYLRQTENDVEIALNPSHVLYDMDSDDEQWISKMQGSIVGNCILVDISEEIFEKTMDMLEKFAYAHQRDQFTLDELEDFTADVGPMEVIKIIYEHWQQKRQKKGMPLIRHLQPPLWESYQQQVKEWELAISKGNSTASNGCLEKAAPTEKPPMFAFCLKPRGLEVPNKGSKQRSHRRTSVSGQSNAVFGDHDSYHPFGRKSNGFAFGDPSYSYDSLEDSPGSQASPRIFSSWDAGNTGYHHSTGSDAFDRSHYHKFQRSKSRKVGGFLSSNDMQMMASHNRRFAGKRNGIYQWNTGFPEWSNQHHYYTEGFHRNGPEQYDSSDLDDFRLHDASNAAQQARTMAKFKRERAQRLLCRADQAIHKAVIALMTAEAVKGSPEDANGDLNGDG